MPGAADFPKVIRSGPRDVNKVAITFDDGPDDSFTPQVLEILKESLIPATFFVTGEMSKRYPSVLRRILEEGHVLGNHSWDHPKFPDFPLEKTFNQLGNTNMTVFQLAEKRMRLFRPPYGAIDEEEMAASYSTGFFIINWDVDTRDWDKEVTAEQIIKAVKENVKPGSIILMHSVPWILQDRLHALKEIIHYVKNDLGLTFVTVDELVGIPAYINNQVVSPGIPIKHHVVQSGDTLNKIALKYGVSVEEIAKENGIKNPNLIMVGQKINIPPASSRP